MTATIETRPLQPALHPLLGALPADARPITFAEALAEAQAVLSPRQQTTRLGAVFTAAKPVPGASGLLSSLRNVAANQSGRVRRAIAVGLSVHPRR